MEDWTWIMKDVGVAVMFATGGREKGKGGVKEVKE